MLQRESQAATKSESTRSSTALAGLFTHTMLPGLETEA